jgi:hypothetical protein
MNESWNNMGGHPCLACQFAIITYRNPFHLRFQKCLRVWLHSEDSEGNNSKVILRPSPSHVNMSVHNMIQRRNLPFEHSFQEIKSKTTPEQRKYVFENLSLLQSTFQSNHADSKRGHPLQEYNDDIASIQEETMSPKKKSTNSKTLSQDKSGSNTTEIPFAALGLNLLHTVSTERLSYPGNWKLSKRDRVKKVEEKHNK